MTTATEAAAAGGAPVEPRLAAWLTSALGDPGPFDLVRLAGGNSNETLLLRSPGARRILRRPPPASLSPTAHDMVRERRVLAALHAAVVAVPEPLALCTDPAVAPAPLLVMEHVHGVVLRDRLPDGWPRGAETARAIGEAVIDALAAVHMADWQAAGLDGFGRPEGFLARQVPRWRKQYQRHQVRDLPVFDELAAWLEAHRPPEAAPALLHGDFHLDNCILAPDLPVAVAAIIDWEMATIGDPMLDVGLFLAFWGTDRPPQPAWTTMQAVSRVLGAPSRGELAERYAAATGRDVTHLRYYLTLAFWKLAAIVEGAYAHHVAGRLRSDYARGLGADVPRLLDEAAGFAGLR